MCHSESSFNKCGFSVAGGHWFVASAEVQVGRGGLVKVQVMFWQELEVCLGFEIGLWLTRRR